MSRLLAAFLACLAFSASPSRADGPEDTVRWIYASLAASGTGPKGLAYLAAPERRTQYFTARMVDWFEIDDTYRSEGLPGCWPHMFDVPDAGADPAEIARTLTVTSTYGLDRQTVTASFSAHRQLARIVYDFVAEDGFMRIDDVKGPGWAVSRIACKPLNGDSTHEGTARGEENAARIPRYSGEAAAYCYATAGDRLRLQVQKDGSARLHLVSLQLTGQKCEAEGPVRWTGRGWVFEPAGEAHDCRLEILLTSDRGLRLSDRDFSCKPWLCGPRAALEGLRFRRADQVDCALSGQD